MELSLADEANNYGGEPRWLLTQKAEDGLRFRFLRERYAGGEPRGVARHRHPFAQVRWAAKGPRCIGPDQFIQEGDIAYFPRAAYYGPEILGDIPGVVATTLQFGFEPDYTPMRGEIEWRLLRDGVDPAEIAATLPSVAVHANSETDPDWKNDDTSMDAWRVAARPVAGRDLGAPGIAPSGYDSVIMIHPSAFSFFEEAPGVEIKRLGSFYDSPGPNGDARLAMIRLSKGGVFRLGGERAQLLWTISPGMRVEQRSLPGITSVYSPLHEQAEITADETAEAYVVEFPRRD